MLNFLCIAGLGPKDGALAAAAAAERAGGAALEARMAAEAARACSSGAAADGGALWTLADGDPDPSPVSKSRGRAGAGPCGRFDLEERLREARQAAQRLTALMEASADAC